MTAGPARALAAALVSAVVAGCAVAPPGAERPPTAAN
jgi:hypothetical protein